MQISKLNFDVDLLEECKKELDYGIINKEEFLKSLLVKRLEKCNSFYLEGFDRALRNIQEDIENGSCDIKRFSTILKKLSKVTDRVCSTELTLFNILSEEEKNERKL